MRTLAIETSTAMGSIAALAGDQLIAKAELGRVQRTAQSLAPTLQSILTQASWHPRDVQLIAVADGPGSFTGLRAGVTTAKVFAYATGADVIALNTLEIIAAQTAANADRLWVIMDAQRQQVFAAQFSLTGDDLPGVTGATEIMDNESFIKLLVAGDVVSGPGLVKLADQLSDCIIVVEDEAWAPQAETLGRLAIARHRRGERTDFWKIAPQYFRKSAAEEKFDEGLLK